MRLLPSAEQLELRAAVRALMAEHASPTDVRTAMTSADGFDSTTWRLVAAQMELPGLALPEHCGGAGAGLVELCIVMEEMGRALFSSPYLATAVLAARLLLHSDDRRAQLQLLPDLLVGARTATVAYAAAAGIVDQTTDPVTAERTLDGGWTVTGTEDLVLDGCSADLVFVVAPTPEGPTVFAVQTAGPGVDRRARTPFDGTRRLGRLRLSAAPARMIGEPGRGRAALDRTLDEARIALAAEQLGAAQACLTMAVEYAKGRKQFGRPIGSFQAVQHKCADVLIAVESARAGVDFASHLGADGSELAVAAGIAAICASDALVRAASECIQIHGGMGFTWEHDAHLYLRRAKSSEQLFGSPRFHEDRLLAEMT